jgi:UDP-glucose 4-epimerase
MARIILGGSGLVGSAVAELSTRLGKEVIAPKSGDLNLLSPLSELNLKKIISEQDDIIMLAAMTPEKLTQTELVYQNIHMFRNFLNSLLNVNFRHLIYVSSDAIFSFNNDVITEDSLKIPDSLYGYSHLVREEMIKRTIPKDKFTILRPCAIYGKNDRHNSYGVMRLYREAKAQGIITLFGNGEDMRDHVFIDDFAQCIDLALDKKISGDYNYATGKSISFSDIATLIKNKTQIKIHLVKCERKLELKHRHFDTKKLKLAFPEHYPRPLEVILSKVKLGD